MRKRTAARSAFTLVEVLVVIAIIGILAGIVMGIAGASSRKSDSSRCAAELEQLKNAMEEYRLESGSYFTGNGDVTAISGLSNALVRYSTDLRFRDPWGRGYMYTNSGFAFTFWSKGLDGVDGNTDDINSSRGGY